MEKTAKWHLYKFNLMQGDEICQRFPDSLSQRHKSLADVALEFSEKRVEGDTISYIYFFEDGIAPCHSYFHSISFLPNSDSLVINKFGKIGFIIHKDELEEEFSIYLEEIQKNDGLSEDLLKLAINYKVL